MNNVNLDGTIDIDFLADNFSKKLGTQVSKGVKRLSKSERIIRKELKERNAQFQKQIEALKGITPAPRNSKNKEVHIMQGYRSMTSKNSHYRING